jgi:glycerol dehydrogenase-like iron-containing ADH family enzyme
MKRVKERLTVTVDPALVQAGNEAVAAGRADSLSSWVNLALAERTAKERRLKAMAEAIAAYEEMFGAISADELSAQVRADQRNAHVVRGKSRPAARTHRRRGAA